MAESLFPALSRDSVLAFQFSSWYPRFASLSIKSTVVRPLSDAFRNYLDADGVFVPHGSENVPAQSALSDEDESDREDSGAEGDADAHSGSGSDDGSGHASPPPHYAFPELDAQIRKAVDAYGAVFPKLNFSSPRDAAWVLPAGAPLKCMAPADVYLLLKSSDFISHDLSQGSVFEGCEPSASEEPPYALELVLRKWYAFDPSRELRCFVRNSRLIAMCQRDNVHYEFWNDTVNRNSVRDAVKTFWEEKIRDLWLSAGPPDYIFDILLTRELTRAHIVDFNPYAPRTDPLLFSFDELADLCNSSGQPSFPEFQVIDSSAHPAASRNAPTHQHNMVPLEAIHLSDGRSIEEFAQRWASEIQHANEQ